MANTTTVTPGDLITAELMNEILQRLGALEGKVGTGTAGTIVVPLVVGRTLQQAKAILTAPANQVAPGTVLDTNGKIVNANAPESQQAIVIVQMPPANAQVPPGTFVTMVVAAATAQQPAPKPTIGSVQPVPVAVNEVLTIFGSNFAGTPSLNTVTIGDKSVTPLQNSNSTKLLVPVPAFTGAPTPGGPNKPGIDLTVATPTGGTSAVFKITVAAPNPAKPTITDIAPPTGVVDQPITITGTNFSTTKADNSVTFDNVAGEVLSATATTLSVKVPKGIPGLPQSPNANRTVRVIVKVKNVAGQAELDHDFDGA